MTLWKNVELNIAKLLGGTRVPVTGRQRGATPDIEHPYFSIEVKERQTLPAWILDAMEQAEASKRGDKVPLVVLHGKGMDYKNDLCVMHLGDLVEMYNLQEYLYLWKEEL